MARRAGALTAVPVVASEVPPRQQPAAENGPSVKSGAGGTSPADLALLPPGPTAPRVFENQPLLSDHARKEARRKHIFDLAKTLWDYHHKKVMLEKCDLIL